MIKKPKVIAVCGKGGVGKTSISTIITKVLLEQEGKKILAIDGDPAIGFSTALGVEIGRTVNDIRNDIVERAKGGTKEDKLSILSRIDYELFNAMVEKDGFAFLAIGRPESEGCYCKVNTYLKNIIESLVGNFDYVVIDGEAGIEQINRRVMEEVTHLLLISDMSLKGINVIKTIADVAEKSVKYDNVGVIINRVKDKNMNNDVELGKLELLNLVPEEDIVHSFDIEGKPLLELDESQTVEAVREALINFKVI